MRSKPRACARDRSCQIFSAWFVKVTQRGGEGSLGNVNMGIVYAGWEVKELLPPASYRLLIAPGLPARVAAQWIGIGVEQRQADHLSSKAWIAFEQFGLGAILCDEFGDHVHLDTGAAKDRIAAHDVRIGDDEAACAAEVACLRGPLVRRGCRVPFGSRIAGAGQALAPYALKMSAMIFAATALGEARNR